MINGTQNLQVRISQRADRGHKEVPGKAHINYVLCISKSFYANLQSKKCKPVSFSIAHHLGVNIAKGIYVVLLSGHFIAHCRKDRRLGLVLVRVFEVLTALT